MGEEGTVIAVLRKVNQIIVEGCNMVRLVLFFTFYGSSRRNVSDVYNHFTSICST